MPNILKLSHPSPNRLPHDFLEYELYTGVSNDRIAMCGVSSYASAPPS